MVLLSLIVLILIVFRSWFLFVPLSSGDWEFLYPEIVRCFPLTPSSWFSFRGLGVNSLPTLWIESYYQFSAFVLNQILEIPWVVVEKIVWFWPFLILAIFSSWYLAKTFFPKNRIIQFFAPFIYLFNTYILMVVGGGQMGIAMAYAVAPLVLGLFIRLLTTRLPARQGSRVKELKGLILVGMVLAIQVMFDPRVSFLTMGAVVLYFACLPARQVFSIKYLVSLIVPIVIAVLLHSYWLLPLVLVKGATLPAGLGEPGWVEFLSFADFSNSISLLHPNWPENIFGKTYFMRPEFLILPILAFSSLLFINYSITNYELRIKKNVLFRQKQTCLFFALLGIVGAFLAKGSKPPFGGVYLWLFKYFPGMNMFRDPTKFYLLVALSYSVLIPFSVGQIYLYLRKKFNN